MDVHCCGMEVKRGLVWVLGPGEGRGGLYEETVVYVRACMLGGWDNYMHLVHFVPPALVFVFRQG